MAASKNVTVIPATRNLFTALPTSAPQKRRVAAYARVSTASDEQFTSYQAQIDYYTAFIKSHPEWEFVGVYTDEGISGTSTKKREGFLRMVQDALDGKIDLIVTKSMSRFARNTVDTLVTIREFKEHGIEVFFEKENIYTFDGKGEVLITIMSSLAQEESRSISENVTWGHRKRFADGKLMLPYKQFLGYKKGEDNLPEIVPEEAEIVRRIYRLYLEGKTVGGIARLLTAEGVPTPGGNSKWGASTIDSILSNEKYKGDARLQKTFTVDYLTKKMKVNEGEVPQYYVENSHPAIIDPREWDLVQAERKRRKAIGRRYSGGSLFSCRIVCGDCGGYYGSKVWHSTDSRRKVVWHCNDKYDGQQCETPTLTEDNIKERFLVAVNRMIADKDSILEDCRIMQHALADCTAIDAELEEVYHELEETTALTEQCIAENAQSVQDQREYAARYCALVDRYNVAKDRAEALQKRRDKRQEKFDLIGAFMFELHELDEAITEFDDRLWVATLDVATAYHDGRLIFRFKNGLEIEG